MLLARRFATLRDALREQRTNQRQTGRGIGIHCEELDENLSTEEPPSC